MTDISKSNLGLWDNWYLGLRGGDPMPYGDAASYELAAEWLKPCQTVGDWGCGKGGFKPYVPPPRTYVGFDGSQTPFASEVVDLAEFTYETEGVLLRHVIEHDFRWASILANAVASYTRRFVLVLFTPMLKSPYYDVKQISYTPMKGSAGVPDLSFSEAAILSVAPVHELAQIATINTATQYGAETIFTFERAP